MSDAAPLSEALEDSRPDLTGAQRRKLGDAIIREIAGAIKRREAIGTVRLLPGGSFEITRFTVERSRA